MNKEQNAGTEVDNGVKPIVLPSASLAQSPLLYDALLSKMSNYDNNSDVRKAFDNLWNQQG